MKARQTTLTRDGVTMKAVEFVDLVTGGRVVLPLEAPGYDGNTWSWNGDAEAPTIQPSVLTERAPRDHFYVRGGMIEFLGDCEHEHRGTTLPMKEIYW